MGGSFFVYLCICSMCEVVGGILFLPKASSISLVYTRCKVGGQMAERLGNRATNQKVAGSIPSCAK